MKFSGTTLEKRHKADALIVPCWKGGFAVGVGHLGKQLSAPLELGDFSGLAGETALVYLDSAREKRAILVGLGPESEFSLESLRISYAKALKSAMRCRAKSLSVLLPKVAAGRHGTTRLDVVRAAAEGLLRSNYIYEDLRSKSDVALISKVALVGASPKEVAEAKEAALVAESVAAARNHILGNADDVTPQKLAAWARSIAGKHEKVKATVFDRKRCEKEGMGLLLAVARGSDHDPAFIQLQYRGKPTSKDHTVIIGKGVTYDTGGLSLKPTSGMETMKTDMSGAAAVFGTLAAVAALGLKVNVTAIVAAAENAIDGKSYKVGDIYKAYNGKTVEVVNTDAEGRLTLADALSYAAKNLKPTRMIDLATLTGAIVIALGEEVAAMMTPDDKLAAALMESGQRVGEAVWRMPLVEAYKKGLKSELADMKNCGPRAGSGITAGLFLQEFAGDIPWVHFDIAGVAYTDKPLAGHAHRATGFGVRLLVDFLKQTG